MNVVGMRSARIEKMLHELTDHLEVSTPTTGLYEKKLSLWYIRDPKRPTERDLLCVALNYEQVAILNSIKASLFKAKRALRIE